MEAKEDLDALHEHKPNILEAKAARLAGRKLDWNELDFVGWKEFRRMAPAVVGLEIGRIERLMAERDVGSDTYNLLVRARYALKAFADGLGSAEKDSLPERAEHLRLALLALSMLPDLEEGGETISYAVHRLRYVNDRIDLIY